jgi:hypothetical protein
MNLKDREDGKQIVTQVVRMELAQDRIQCWAVLNLGIIPPECYLLN